jgi:hypothetical protein
VTGGDADAEITLVRQHSTLYRQHKDSKDSYSDDDNNDGIGSGGEDEDYN